MVAVSRSRVSAVVNWVNAFGEALSIAPAKSINDVWKRHLLSLCCMIDSPECEVPDTATASAAVRSHPTEAFEDALGVLEKAFSGRNEFAGRIKQLNVAKAVAGNDTEVYKFVLLIIMDVAMRAPRSLARFCRGKENEQPFAEMVEQLLEKHSGDEWWRTEPMTPLSDSPAPPRNSAFKSSSVLLQHTPQSHRHVRTSRATSSNLFGREEEVFMDESGHSPLLDVLNSPRNTSLRAAEMSRRLDQEREKCKAAREKAVTLEFDLTNKEHDISRLLEENRQAATREKNLKMANATLKMELTSSARALEEQNATNRDLFTQIEHWKAEATEARESAARRRVDLEGLERRVGEQDAQLGELKEKLQEAAAVERDLRYEILNHDERLRRESSAAACLEKELDMARRQLDEMDRERECRRQEQADLLKAKLDEFEMQLSREQDLRISAVAQANLATQTLEERSEEYKRGLAKVQAEHEANFAALQTSLHAIKSTTAVDATSKNQEALEADLAAARAEQRQLYDRLNEVLSSLSEQKLANLELAEARNALEREASTLRNELSLARIDAAHELDQLRHRVSQLTCSAEISTDKVASMQTTIDQLMAQLTDAQAAKATLHTRLEEAIAKQEVARGANLSALERINFLESRSLQEESHLRLEAAALRNQLDEARKECDQLTLKVQEAAEAATVQAQLQTSSSTTTLADSRFENTLLDASVMSGRPELTPLFEGNADEEPEIMETTYLGGATSTLTMDNDSLATTTNEADVNQTLGSLLGNNSTHRSISASTHSFVVPAEPAGYQPRDTDRERLDELRRRNERLPAALQSSYFTETMNYHSPSGNEHNVKSGKENVPQHSLKKKGLSSMSSMFGRKSSKTSIKSEVSTTSVTSSSSQPKGKPPVTPKALKSRNKK